MKQKSSVLKQQKNERRKKIVCVLVFNSLIKRGFKKNFWDQLLSNKSMI